MVIFYFWVKWFTVSAVVEKSDMGKFLGFSEPELLDALLHQPFAKRIVHPRCACQKMLGESIIEVILHHRSKTDTGERISGKV